MKTVVHTNRAKDKILHVEAEGCIVNVHVGLTDNQGHEVTRISVRPDQYAGERRWYIADDEGKEVNIGGLRVLRETEQEYENRRAYERILWHTHISLEARFYGTGKDCINVLTFEKRNETHTLRITKMGDSYLAWCSDVGFSCGYTKDDNLREVVTDLYNYLKLANGRLIAVIGEEE